LKIERLKMIEVYGFYFLNDLGLGKRKSQWCRGGEGRAVRIRRREAERERIMGLCRVGWVYIYGLWVYFGLGRMYGLQSISNIIIIIIIIVVVVVVIIVIVIVMLFLILYFLFLVFVISISIIVIIMQKKIVLKFHSKLLIKIGAILNSIPNFRQYFPP